MQQTGVIPRPADRNPRPAVFSAWNSDCRTKTLLSEFPNPTNPRTPYAPVSRWSSWRNTLLAVGCHVHEIADDRLSAGVLLYLLCHHAIRPGRALVSTQMLRPGIYEGRLQIAFCILEISKVPHCTAPSRRRVCPYLWIAFDKSGTFSAST